MRTSKNKSKTKKGIDFIAMVAGLAFFPKDDANLHARLFSKLLGRVDAALAARQGWSCSVLPGSDGCCIQQKWISPVAGGANLNDHLSILKYDPCARPTASSIAETIVG